MRDRNRININRKSTIDHNHDDLYARGGSDSTIDATKRIIASYSATANDTVIYADTDGGNITINLPIGIEGKRYKLINCGSSGNTLTVDPSGTQQLFGAGAGVASTVADGEIIDINFNATEGWW